jgi:hypothetical protein
MRLPPSLLKDGATPFADLPQLRAAARRTAAVRVVLALSLVVTLALLFGVARSAGAGRAAVFPEGTCTGVVALDMSASISGPTYARVATTLRGIVSANQSIGLVMFSDSAYELLPPNSPPAALQQFIHFFTPVRIEGGIPSFAPTPWDTFMAGTRIAAGLDAARAALVRARVKCGAILLVSDLNDSGADQGALEQEALLLRKLRLPVRIVPLFASTLDLRLFGALFGTNAFVDPHVFTHSATRRAQAVSARSPWLLLVLGGVLVALVGGNERWNARLRAKAAPT